MQTTPVEPDNFCPCGWWNPFCQHHQCRGGGVIVYRFLLGSRHVVLCSRSIRLVLRPVGVPRP